MSLGVGGKQVPFAGDELYKVSHSCQLDHFAPRLLVRILRGLLHVRGTDSSVAGAVEGFGADTQRTVSFVPHIFWYRNY